MMEFADYNLRGTMTVVPAPDGQLEYQLPSLDERRFPFITIIGLVWGLLTGFAYWLYFDAGQVFMSVGLLAAIILSVAYFRSLTPLVAAFTVPAGILVVIHAMAALLSTVFASAPLIVLTARYFVVAIAFSVILCITQQGLGAARALRKGFTIAGLAVSLVNLVHVTPQDLFNPSSRINIVLNPNQLGIVCGFTALSLADFAIGAQKTGRRGRAGFIWMFAAVCVIVVLATKSRTAAAAVVFGGVSLLMFYYGVKRVVLLGALGILLSLLSPQVRDFALRFYQLDEASRRWRDPMTLTGRTAIWSMSIAIWKNSPILGAGPGGLNGGSGHNAFINYLGEVGVLGITPVLILLVMAIAGAVRNRHDSRYFFFISCLVAVLVESSAESSLLNSGNPASLMVLISFAALTGPKQAPFPAMQVASYDEHQAFPEPLF